MTIKNVEHLNEYNDATLILFFGYWTKREDNFKNKRFLIDE